MIYQAQEKGCGYAAIKNLLAFNGYPRAEAIIEPPIAEKAPSLGELIAFASEFGLSLCGHKFLEPSGLASCASFPLLCVMEEGERSHLVLVKRRRKGRFLVCDPAAGESWQKEGGFLAHFSGICLKQVSYEAKGGKGGQLPRIKRPGFAYVLPLFPLLEAALAFFAVAFFRNESNYTLLLLLVASYCLLILSRSVFLMAAMEQFDAKWSFALAKIEKSERKEALKHYLAYKKASIIPWVNLPENIACFAFIFFLVALNEPLFASLTLVPFTALFLDKLFFGKKRKEKIGGISRSENSFLESEESLAERSKQLQDLFSSVSSFSKKELSKKAILVLLCLVSACLGLLGGEFASNRFLLFVFASLYLLSLGEKVFADAEDIGEEKKERGYFYQHFARERDSIPAPFDGKI